MIAKKTYQVIAVILMTLMVSTAFVPAINAQSDSDNENDTTSIVSEVEVSDKELSEYEPLRAIAEALGLDPSSSLDSILGLLGLSGIIDNETFKSLFSPGSFNREQFDSLLAKLRSAAASALESLLTYNGNSVERYHIDYLEVFGIAIIDADIIVGFDDLGQIESVGFEAQTISYSDEETEATSGVENVEAEFSEEYVYLSIEKYFSDDASDQSQDLDFVIEFQVINDELHFHADLMGYSIGFYTQDDVLTVFVVVPELTLNITGLGSVELEGLRISLNSEVELVAFVEKATSGGSDVTSGVNALLKAICDSTEEVTRSISLPGTIMGYTVTNGQLHLDYLKGEKFSLGITADSVAKDGLTITDLSFTIGVTVNDMAQIGMGVGSIAYNGINVGEYTFELVTEFKDNFNLSYENKLDSLRITFGEYTLTWGSESDNAFNIAATSNPTAGTEIKASSAIATLKIGSETEFVIDGTSLTATYLDKTQSLEAYTFDDKGKRSVYLSMDYVQPVETKYIYTKLVINNDVVDEVIAVDFVYPPSGDNMVTVKTGIGFGVPGVAFAAVMYAHDTEGNEGYSIDTEYRANGVSYIANGYLSDDKLELNGFAKNYKIGKLTSKEIGAHFSMTDEKSALSFFMSGVTITDGTNVLTIESATLLMNINIGGSTEYTLTIDGGYLGDKNIADNATFKATVGSDGKILSTEFTAKTLDFDLGDGIAIGSTKTLKGTGTVGTDGPVLDVYLKDQRDNAHIYANSEKLDVYFDGTIGTSGNQKLGLQIDKTEGTVTRTVDAAGYGGVFKVESIKFDETTDTLTIGKITLLNGVVTITGVAGTFDPANGHTFSVQKITGEKSTGASIAGSITMGTDSDTKAFSLETKVADGKVQRTVAADLQSISVNKDGTTILSVGTGSYTETTVDGIPTATNAELNNFNFKLDDSNYLKMTKITMKLDSEKFTYNLTTTGVEAAVQGLKAEAEKIALDAKVVLEPFSLNVGVVSENVKIPFTNNSASAEMTIDKISEQVTVDADGISASATIDSAEWNASQTDQDRIDIRNVKISYTGDDGTDLTYDKIYVKLTNASLGSIITGIQGAIDLTGNTTETVAQSVDFTIGQINAGSLFVLSNYKIQFATDADGKITTALSITIDGISSKIETEIINFESTATDIKLIGNTDGNEYTVSVKSIQESVSAFSLSVNAKQSDIKVAISLSETGYTVTADGKFEFNINDKTLVSAEIDDLVVNYALSEDAVTVKITVKTASLQMNLGDTPVFVDMSGSSANGTITFDEESFTLNLTSAEKVTFGVKDTVEIYYETTDAIDVTFQDTVVDYPTSVHMKSTVNKITVTVHKQSFDAKNIDIVTEITAEDLTTSPGIEVVSQVNFNLEADVGQEHYFVKVSNAKADVSFDDTGMTGEFNVDRIDYGSNRYSMALVGGTVSSIGLVFSEIYFKDTDNKVDIVFHDSLFFGQITYASAVTGTIDGVDVGTIKYEGKALGEFYSGTYYFDPLSGVKAFKYGEEIVIPDNVFHIHLMPIEVTFSDIDMSYDMPVGTILEFNKYYDIVGDDVAVTQDSYQLTYVSESLVITPAKTIDEIIDKDTGVAQVDGSGIVFTPSALDKLTVKEVTIINGNDMTVKISVDALKRLATGTEITMLGFDNTAADDENLADVLGNLTDEQKTMALSGTIVIADIGNSTVTDNLGNVEITLPFSIGTMDQNNLKAYYIDGDKLELVSSVTYNGNDSTATFTTTHFSSFLICEDLGISSDEHKTNFVAVLIAVIAISAILILLTQAMFRNKKETA